VVRGLLVPGRGGAVVRERYPVLDRLILAKYGRGQLGERIEFHGA